MLEFPDLFYSVCDSNMVLATWARSGMAVLGSELQVGYRAWHVMHEFLGMLVFFHLSELIDSGC